MFAIMNIKTGKFLFGTDYRYDPPRQRTSNCQMMTFPDELTARTAFVARRCCKNYRVVVLKTIEVKRRRKVTNFEWLLENEREEVLYMLARHGAVDNKGNFTACEKLNCSDCILSDLYKNNHIHVCTVLNAEWLNSEREEKKDD